MSEDQKDEYVGIKAAKRFLDGDLAHPIDGYGGKAPNGSLINKKRVEFIGKDKLVSEDVNTNPPESEVIDTFPQITENSPSQQRQFPQKGQTKEVE